MKASSMVALAAKPRSGSAVVVGPAVGDAMHSQSIVFPSERVVHGGGECRPGDHGGMWLVPPCRLDTVDGQGDDQQKEGYVEEEDPDECLRRNGNVGYWWHNRHTPW
jgi:hypothetical protein